MAKTKQLCSKCLQPSKDGLMHPTCLKRLNTAHSIAKAEHKKRKTPPLYKHQKKTIDKLRTSEIVYDTSDAGTGKTRPALEAWWERRIVGGGRLLVVGVRSSLESVWADQANMWIPAAGVGIAFASNRLEPFLDHKNDIVVINTDGVNWIEQNKNKIPLHTFDSIIVDESTYFKHRTSNRSKSLKKIITNFTFRELLTGTPNPNSVTDIWHQAYLLDDGQRLGANFYAFRAVVCEQDVNIYGSKTITKWIDKPQAMQAVANKLSDITVRNKFEECTSIPANVRRYVEYKPSIKLLRIYRKFKEDTIVKLDEGEVTGVNAASVMQKLLQICSGAVYGENKKSYFLDSERYELISDLVLERESCVVFYMWEHQRDLILKYLRSNNVAVKAMDGTTPDAERAEYVREFQRGDIRVLVLHPQTGSHALTLTKGTTCIWASPTYRADYLRQGIHRIYRSGQTRKTETIFVHAKGTLESGVYEKVLGKEHNMDSLLTLIKDNQT